MPDNTDSQANRSKTGDSSTAAGSDTRRGHMVTRGYLAAWADKRNIVDVIDIKAERAYRTSIVNASVVTDVYDSAVMANTLEREFAAIESKGMSAINRLRASPQLLPGDKEAIIAFLDMHLHRGRYADRADTEVGATLVMTDLSFQDVKLKLGDMLALTHQYKETLRLTDLDLLNWDWRVHPFEGLYTGDGAVLLWALNPESELRTITFPLSPTKLLSVGEILPDGIDVNLRLLANCRRWIIGQKGSLPIDAAKKIADQQERDG